MKKYLLAMVLLSLFLFVSCNGKNTQSPSDSQASQDSPQKNNTSSSITSGGDDTSFDSSKNTEAESSSQTPSSDTTDNNTDNPGDITLPLNYDNMKAMWLSQFDLNSVYTSSGGQRNKDDFTKRVKTIVSNVKKNGFNTVILQVRPYADSFYPSDIYPPSKYVTGSYANNFTYDAVEIFVDACHAEGLSIHAWINPLRCMTPDEIKSVSDSYKIKQWYNSSEYNGKYVVEFNGRLYLNPAYEAVRSLITDGAYEILDKYSFDGLHMDDYFYPTTSEDFDKAAFTEYKASNPRSNLKTFRYENLNKLVSSLYSTVKSKNEKLLYGISPEGNISNATQKSYADVYTWLSNDGYVDYICPQVYFGFEHATCAFDELCSKWQSLIKKDSIKLVIGMTLGKAYSQTDKWAGSGQNEWKEHTDILKRCLEYTMTLDKCTGVSYFCYQYFYEPVSEREVSQTAQERANLIPVLQTAKW